jgi:elongation factor P
MKINGNAIRPGNIIEHKGELWSAVKIQHTQPGKGGAYLQVELKNLRSNSKLNERFRASEDVEKVRLEQRDCQYLYENDGMYTFMDNETYDQDELNSDLLGDSVAYLKEGMVVVIESHEGTPLRVSLPDSVTFEVAETAPALKGQTAAASFKPATLDNGLSTNVPPFVEVGDRVVINTEDGSYVKRADD